MKENLKSMCWLVAWLLAIPHVQCLDQYRLGLMGPISASDNFLQIVMGGAVAFDMINNHGHSVTQQLYPNIDFTIEYPIFDDGGNPSLGIDAAFRMVFSGKYNGSALEQVLPTVLGIVGPGYSSVSKPVSLLASVNTVPLMSYSATSGQLSDKSQYPNFARVVPSDDVESTVMGAFVEAFGWREVIIFACDDDFCTGYADSLNKQRFDYGYTVAASTTFPVQDHEGDGSGIKAALRSIRDLNCRIILMPILPMHVPYIHKYMEELGMYSDNDDSFVWITPMGTATEDSQDQVEHKRGGHLVVQYRTPSNDIYVDGLQAAWASSIDAYRDELRTNPLLSTRVLANWPTVAAMDVLLSDMAGATGSFTPYVFDCALVLVKAIYDLRAQGHGLNITSDMILAYLPNIGASASSPFMGATGSIQFTSDLDRLVDFELVNLRSDLTGDSSYDYHAVRYWSAPDGQAGNEHGIVVAASNDFDVHWSSTIDGVPDHFMGAGEDEGLSTEALVLISVGTVAGIALLAFFARYLKSRWVSEAGQQRYDPNVEHRRRVLLSIVKSLMAFSLEVADYVTDAMSAANVFSLYEKDILDAGLVVFYVMVLSVGGMLNFGNMLWRSRNLIEMLKEYSQGVSISAAEAEGKLELLNDDEDNKGGRQRQHSLAEDIDTLRKKGSQYDIKLLQDLTVKIVNTERSIRIEKFTFVLGLLEDLPIAIMNSVLMLGYMDDINFTVIYFSTLTTLLEFGVKMISLEKVLMLKSRLRDLKAHVNVQRKYSLSQGVIDASDIEAVV